MEKNSRVLTRLGKEFLSIRGTPEWGGTPEAIVLRLGQCSDG